MLHIAELSSIKRWERKGILLEKRCIMTTLICQSGSLPPSLAHAANVSISPTWGNSCITWASCVLRWRFATRLVFTLDVSTLLLWVARCPVMPQGSQYGTDLGGGSVSNSPVSLRNEQPAPDAAWLQEPGDSCPGPLASSSLEVCLPPAPGALIRTTWCAPVAHHTIMTMKSSSDSEFWLTAYNPK